MSSLVLTGDTSGQVTISAPAVAGTSTLTLQAGTATNSMNTLATAVASTSGTSITFTGIPSWVKRITMMLVGVSTSGSSQIQIQLGSGSATTTGYSCSASVIGVSSVTSSSYTTGFATRLNSATNIISGNFVTTLVTGNTWSGNGAFAAPIVPETQFTTGSVALAGVLDRIILTTFNGTDTFDAGTINILYEG